MWAHQDLGQIWGSFNPRPSLGCFGVSPGHAGTQLAAHAGPLMRLCGLVRIPNV